jgi:hypothetical protein
MNIENEIRNAYLSGQPISEWHNKRIKTNNKQWFLLVCLIITIFVGYIHIQNERNINLVNKVKSKDSIIDIQVKQIDTLQYLVNEAVYFKDIQK